MKSQVYIPEILIDSSSKSIQLYTDFDFGTKGISNATISKFLNKEYFSNTDKKSVLKQLHSQNSIGYDFTATAIYSFKFRKNKYIQIEAGERSHLDAKLTKPLMQLALYGNSYYAGQNMDISDNSYHNISWQYIGAAIKFQQKKYIITTGLYLASIYWHTLAQAKSGNLYTDDAGEYINLRLDGTFKQSKPLSHTLWKLSGIGGTGSFDMIIPGKTYAWQFGFKELGVAKMVNQVQQITLDTTIHFEGITLSNFRILSSDSSKKQFEDSLKSIPGNYIQNQNYFQMLPALFYIKYFMQWGKDRISAVLDYRINAYPLPRLAFTYYKVFRRHSLNTQITLGGYSYYDLNLGYSYLSKKNKIDINLKGIKGLIAPKVFSGAGLFINFAHQFH